MACGSGQKRNGPSWSMTPPNAGNKRVENRDVQKCELRINTSKKCFSFCRLLPWVTAFYSSPISPRLDVVPESRQTVRRTCQKGGTSDDEILRSSRSPPLPQSRCQALEGRCGIARRIHDRESHLAAKPYPFYREGTRVGSSHGATALYQVL